MDRILKSEKGSVSPYLVMGIIAVAVLIIVMLFSGREQNPTSSLPAPTSGAETPQ